MLLVLVLIYTFLPSSDTDSSLDLVGSSENISDVLSDDIIEDIQKDESSSDAQDTAIDFYGSYTSKEDVALYIHTYGCLPQNFVTKDEAEKAGWSGGSVERYLPGMCIGGDRFGNREGLLPKANGRTWTECDINTLGADGRGAERIVFSNDGLIYYTGDHYESFELLYD